MDMKTWIAIHALILVEHRRPQPAVHGSGKVPQLFTGAGWVAHATTGGDKCGKSSEDTPLGRHFTRHFTTKFSRPSLIRPFLFVTFSKGVAGASGDSWAVRSMRYQIKDQCLFFQACRGCDLPLALFFAQLFHSSLHSHHHHHSLVSVMVLFPFTPLTFRHSFQVLLTIHLFLLMTMKFTSPYF